MYRRPATPADLPWASDLVRDGIRPWLGPDFAWDEAAVRRGTAERLVGAEVIELDGVRIGWMRVLDDGERVVLDQIFLEAGWRGRGLGTRLVREVLARARRRPVDLRVVKGNPALRLYRRVGFRVAADRGHQWFLTREPGWDGPLPLPSWRGPTADQLRAVVARAGLDGSVTPMPSGGSANDVFAVGDAVLRIARATPDGMSDARTEAAAVPPVVAAGVRSPALLAFDETGRDVPVPFTAYVRIDGEPARHAPASIWREVGRELAGVHGISWIPDGAGWLDDPSLPDPLALLDHAPDPAPLARWLRTLPVEPVAPRFLHGDLHPENVLVRDGRLAAIIDWGDAARGDPALDFEPMPTLHLPSAVLGYREASGVDDPTLEARVLRACLSVALLRIARPKPNRRPTARLEELLAFACSRPPPPWDRLVAPLGR